MTALVLIAAAAVACWYATRRPRTGPGVSAAAHARRLRTPWVRLASAFGIRTLAAQRAARFEAGAVGEQRTAARLAPLLGEGWTVLHDRALPRSRANVDHLVIGPRGAVILPDSKRWSARYRLRVVDGRLLHGNADVTDRLNGLRHEAHAVATVLKVLVTPLVVVDGAPIDGGELHVDGLRIIPAQRLVTVLRALDAANTRPLPAGLRGRAPQLLPPYLERSR